MNLQNLIAQAKEYLAFLKTHSFGDKIMRKRTISSLEKLIIFASVSIFCLIVSFVFVIFPGIAQIQEIKEEKLDIMSQTYGKTGEKEGLLYVNQRKKQILETEERKFNEARAMELEKYNQALVQDNTIYNIAVLLEDYAVTFNSEEKPLTINNISFGKKFDVSIPPQSLKQEQDKGTARISLPAEYSVLPLTVSLESHKDNFEQFLKFVYHSGDIKQFYFKGNPVPMMSIESLSLPVDVTDDKPVNTYSLKLNFYLQKEKALKPKAEK